MQLQQPVSPAPTFIQIARMVGMAIRCAGFGNPFYRGKLDSARLRSCVVDFWAAVAAQDISRQAINAVILVLWLGNLNPSLEPNGIAGSELETAFNELLQGLNEEPVRRPGLAMAAEEQVEC